ncbi:MAG: UpxY family transcription antiterminator [Bacteroidales bacterium]|jgi:transcription antitermination factor NusG|nr:UpxY family transcription antiterminator [Bacteroidales bacterium]
MKSIIETSSKKWHVVYTRSRAEKKVYSDLKAYDIECFLPLKKQLRHFKNRKKWVEITLISGYCFVNITRKDYDRVLQVNNVVSYVAFERKAAIVPDKQIDYLKQMLRQSDFDVEVTNNNFSPGKKVMVVEGPLMGLSGELMEERGKKRFLLRIAAINTVCSVVVPSEILTALPSDN